MDHLMVLAWRDFVDWASRNDEIVARFNAETGKDFGQPRSPVSAMIDRACGKDESDADAFILWVTERHWGVDEAPESVRAKIQAVKAITHNPGYTGTPT